MFLNGAQAVVAGAIVNSSSCLAYGLESFVDVMASALVLWRFWEEADDPKGLAANIGREERTNVGIAATVSNSTPISCLGDVSRCRQPFIVDGSWKCAVHFESQHSEGIWKALYKLADMWDTEHAGSGFYEMWLHAPFILPRMSLERSI